MSVPFCVLLGRLGNLWMDTGGIPNLADRYTAVAEFARQIRELGLANFIYCDGDTMFVHADRRRQADGEFREPGLWMSQQACPGGAEKISGGGVDIRSPEQQIAIAASVPLTRSGWEPMPAGSLIALKNGAVAAT